MWWILIYGIVTFTICEGSILTQVDMTDPIQKFSNDMYQILGQTEFGNMVYSPYSIHTTMAMVLGGSPRNSSTFKQLAEVLGVKNISPKSFQIDHSLLRSFYSEVHQRNMDINSDDPNLEIINAHRIFAKKDLNIRDDYTLAMDTFFRAGTQSILKFEIIF